MDHLGIPLDVALALRLARAQPRRGRGALPHRAAPHGCRNQRREPRDLPNQAAILRPRVCVCLSLERHSLRSHSGYTRARHPVTLFHGNEATLPSPHHKDQPGSHALSTLGCTRKIQEHTRAHRTLTQTLTHTRNVQRCTYGIGRENLGCTRGSPASGPAVRGAATQRYTLRGCTCSPSVLVVAGTGPTAATWHARAVRVRDVASLSAPSLTRSRRHL